MWRISLQACSAGLTASETALATLGFGWCEWHWTTAKLRPGPKGSPDVLSCNWRAMRRCSSSCNFKRRP
jgi:hypothetical protein